MIKDPLNEIKLRLKACQEGLEKKLFKVTDDPILRDETINTFHEIIQIPTVMIEEAEGKEIDITEGAGNSIMNEIRIFWGKGLDLIKAIDELDQPFQ